MPWNSAVNLHILKVQHNSHPPTKQVILVFFTPVHFDPSLFGLSVCLALPRRGQLPRPQVNHYFDLNINVKYLLVLPSVVRKDSLSVSDLVGFPSNRSLRANSVQQRTSNQQAICKQKERRLVCSSRNPLFQMWPCARSSRTRALIQRRHEEKGHADSEVSGLALNVKAQTYYVNMTQRESMEAHNVWLWEWCGNTVRAQWQPITGWEKQTSATGVERQMGWETRASGRRPYVRSSWYVKYYAQQSPSLHTAVCEGTLASTKLHR